MVWEDRRERKLRGGIFSGCYFFLGMGGATFIFGRLTFFPFTHGPRGLSLI